MPGVNEAETIRILISTDNHVGYNERDPIRGDDSWKTFHEIMCMAKDQDVDMVLLAGDLFHENKPSRKSMYQVMRSIRMNCFGDKPCELEMLSDASENFQGAFNHVNYEDLDMNVAIPIFSIHGNHDDPSGEGHLAALDLLQVSGLLNYYGRTPESDNIEIKPVLLQKGRTKLALYGMSNVRDERLFRTFRDGKVKFFKPSVQKDDWFNLMSVHQNHHAYTETGYLPENFLPDFMDMVIWGHEHECLIDPKQNPETKFHVIQPGSSVATSLVPGEAVTKQVTIMSITGREFKCEPIRLKSVRPFVMREIVLSEEKGAQKLARKENNRTEVTRYLMSIIEELIEEANEEWLENHPQAEGEDEDPPEIPLPLVRLRVEISTPEGGSYECENPQRFSNRFVGKVANVNDVVQFHRKKKSPSTRKGEALDEAATSHLTALDTVKVEQLVKEFLASQSLSILPQNTFGDAVAQFIDKDDKHAMEMFVNESLEGQVKHLMTLTRDEDCEEDEEGEQSSLVTAMEKYRTQMEELFSKGVKRRTRGKKRFKPKPDGWDSEFDGTWEDQPGALIHSDNEDGDPAEEEAGEGGAAPARSRASATTSTRGRGRGRGRGASTTARGAAKATTAAKGRKKQVVSEEESEADDDVVMLEDEDEDNAADDISDDDDSQALFVKQPRAATSSRGRKTTSAARTSTTRGRGARTAASPAASSTTTKATTTRRTTTRAAKPTQSTLDFGSQASASANPSSRPKRATRNISVISDDDDDDDDAFEPVETSSSRRRR